jgi:hypothetical protein
MNFHFVIDAIEPGRQLSRHEDTSTIASPSSSALKWFACIELGSQPAMTPHGLAHAYR